MVIELNDSDEYCCMKKKIVSRKKAKKQKNDKIGSKMHSTRGTLSSKKISNFFGNLFFFYFFTFLWQSVFFFTFFGNLLEMLRDALCRVAIHLCDQY
jgi:myosin-crossreactive antigen